MGADPGGAEIRGAEPSPRLSMRRAGDGRWGRWGLLGLGKLSYWPTAPNDAVGHELPLASQKKDWENFAFRADALPFPCSPGRCRLSIQHRGR
jgi:hypothetical protein